MTRIPTRRQALLFAALAALALPAAAQVANPAPEADIAAETTLDEAVPADTVTLAGAEIQPDARCLQHTGSRVTGAARHSRVVRARTDASGRVQCAHAPGTAYDRDDLDRTGATTIKEALERLDPRVF
ncbi:hypothetical protein GCM10028862_12510 [Luteimonas pelagia]